MEGFVAGTVDGDAFASFGRERADAIPLPRTTPFEMASLLLTGSIAPWLHPETAVMEAIAARAMILHMVMLCEVRGSAWVLRSAICDLRSARIFWRGTAFLARPSTSTSTSSKL